MDGITDSPFRQIVKKYGNPDLIFTEFEHVISICIAGYNILNRLDFNESERPIIAQIYGNNPEYFYHAAKVICALGFDGVDINMGCPAKNVANSGAGAGLIKTPNLAIEIIRSARQGVIDWVSDQKLTGLNPKSEVGIWNQIEINKLNALPNREKSEDLAWFGVNNLVNTTKKPITVSVKTRIGYDIPITSNWISTLDSAQPDWISIHGRTLKQMYAPSAQWDQIAIGVKSTSKPVLANGDVQNRDDFYRILEVTGARGVLIGRATFGNPWIFSEIRNPSSILHTEKEEKKRNLEILLEHLDLFSSLYSSPKAFVQLRKHFGWYTKGFARAKELREKLMRIDNREGVRKLIFEFLGED